MQGSMPIQARARDLPLNARLTWAFAEVRQLQPGWRPFSHQASQLEFGLAFWVALMAGGAGKTAQRGVLEAASEGGPAPTSLTTTTRTVYSCPETTAFVTSAATSQSPLVVFEWTVYSEISEPPPKMGTSQVASGLPTSYGTRFRSGGDSETTGTFKEVSATCVWISCEFRALPGIQSNVPVATDDGALSPTLSFAKTRNWYSTPKVRPPNTCL